MTGLFDWKYTKLKELEPQGQTAESSEFSASSKLDDLTHAEDLNIIFVNGQLYQCPEPELLPKGLSIEQAETADTSRFAEQEPLEALSKSTVQNQLNITVQAEASIEPLVHIVHVHSQEDCRASNSFAIELQKHSELKLLESHISLHEEHEWSNQFTRIVQRDSSKLNYTYLQNSSLKATHLCTSIVIQEANSQFEGFVLHKGSGLVRHNIQADLTESGALHTLKGLYLLDGTQHCDNNLLLRHLAAGCTSDQLYKGLLDGKSRGIFSGKIIVEQDAQQTSAKQNNKNLLLSDKAHADSQPQLEISADDVKCAHGSSIGQINEDELFYLQSRALDKQTATKMLCQGFVYDLIEQETSAQVKQRIMELL